MKDKKWLPIVISNLFSLLFYSILICVFAYPIYSNADSEETFNQFYITYNKAESPLTLSDEEWQYIISEHLQWLKSMLPDLADQEAALLDLSYIRPLSKIKGGMVFSLSQSFSRVLLEGWFDHLKGSNPLIHNIQIDLPTKLEQVDSSRYSLEDATLPPQNLTMFNNGVLETQWHLGPFPGINAVPAWSITKGRGVRVLIQDVYFCLESPAITEDRLMFLYNYGSDSIRWPNQLDLSLIEHEESHRCNIYRGSHGKDILLQLATLHQQVSSFQTGMLPDATYILMDFPTDGIESGTISALIAGLDEAIIRGAQVFNLSQGIGYPNMQCPEELQQAIDRAAKAGIQLINSAGNAGRTISEYNTPVPKVCQNVMVTGNTQRDGGLHSTSNFGSHVDIAAPGVATHQHHHGGTSNAAPYVAGTAAMMLAVDSGLPIWRQAQILKQTAVYNITDCPECKCPFGVVDSYAAVQQVISGIESGIQQGEYTTHINLPLDRSSEAARSYSRTIRIPAHTTGLIQLVDSKRYQGLSLLVRRQPDDMLVPDSDQNLCTNSPTSCLVNVSEEPGIYEIAVNHSVSVPESGEGSGFNREQTEEETLDTLIGPEVRVSLFPRTENTQILAEHQPATVDRDGGTLWSAWRRHRPVTDRADPAYFQQAPDTVQLSLPAFHRSFTPCLVPVGKLFWHGVSKKKAEWTANTETPVPGIVNSQNRCQLWGASHLNSAHYDTLLTLNPNSPAPVTTSISTSTSLQSYQFSHSKSIGYSDENGQFVAFCYFEEGGKIISGWADRSEAVCHSKSISSTEPFTLTLKESNHFTLNLQ